MTTTTTTTTEPTTIYAAGLGMHISTAASAALTTRLQNEVVNAISTIGFSYNFITTILDQTTGTKPADASAKLIAEMSFNLNWLAGQIEAEPILSTSQDIFNLLHNGRNWLYQAHDLQVKAEISAVSYEETMQQVTAIIEGAEEGIFDPYTTLQHIAEAVLGKQIDLTQMKNYAQMERDIEDIHTLQAECDVIFGVMDAPSDLPEADLQALQNDFIFGDDEDDAEAYVRRHDDAEKRMLMQEDWDAALNEKDSPAGW